MRVSHLLIEFLRTFIQLSILHFETIKQLTIRYQRIQNYRHVTLVRVLFILVTGVATAPRKQYVCNLIETRFLCEDY